MDNEPKNYELNFKSNILLPVIFLLTLTVGICMFFIEDFSSDFNPIVIWFYFAVVIAYVVIAFIDARLSKIKSNKMKKFIMIMATATLASDAVFIIAYLLTKGA